MARTRKLTVEIAGDASGVRRAFGQTERHADGLGRKLASFGKVAALGLAGAAVGAVALGKGFVDAAVESQKVTKQTEAVIKSMGGAANVTSKQVADLSTALSLQTGVDDELIQSGSNILLTFGKVRNELGKGNKIFDRATQAALDMSVALGTDMKSASMLVGKALNDPIRGLTALRRTGIQFTKQQEDQIKAMVEVGDTMGAQKVILSELTKQFGGSAKAQATAQDKLKVAWGNLQEQLGEKLLPVVERLATWLAEKLPGAMTAVSRAFDEAKPHIKEIADAVKRFVTDALEVMKTWWDNNGATVVAAAKTLATGVKEAFDRVVAAGKFVIDHWDQFKVLAGAMVTLVITHYVRLAVAAVASSVKQAAAWVATEAAAIKAAVVHVAQVAIMVAKWAFLAARAAFHAAAIATAWVVTHAGATAATAKTIAAATAQGGAWAGLAVAAETSSARIAKAWLAVLGPAAAVIAAAETINNLTGNKLNPNDLNLWERLDPRKAFKGIEFDIPFFASGGVMPGPRGQHSLAMVAGGETILPTHQAGFAATLQRPSQPIIHTHLYLNGREIAEAVSDYNAVQSRNRAS